MFHTFRETYTALFINDEFKVSDKLTLTAGLRFDYESARTEREEPGPDLQRDDTEPRGRRHSGGVHLRGRWSGSLGTDPSSRTFPRMPLGPRVGFAYRIDEKQALRGGYGIDDANVAFNQGGAPTQGFASSPFAPNNTNGIQPAHHLDAGLPRGQNPFPPFIDPTINIGGNVIAVNARWLDVATVPELVADATAAAQRQHDADDVLHRESRQPAEPSLCRPTASTRT